MKRESGFTNSWNWHYIAVSLVVVTILTLTVLYVPDIREMDFELLKSIQKLCSPYPNWIPFIVNEIARFNYFWPLLASCSVLVSHRYYSKALMLLLFTQAAYYLTDFLKNIVCRERPCSAAVRAGYSFPSGHTLVAMTFFGILIYLVQRHICGFWKYFLTTVFCLLIILAALTRLMLNVHFATDVLAGLFTGFILVNFYALLDRAIG